MVTLDRKNNQEMASNIFMNMIALEMNVSEQKEMEIITKNENMTENLLEYLNLRGSNMSLYERKR